MGVSGIEDIEMLGRQITAGAEGEQAMADALHGATVGDWSRKRSQIKRDTGALARSLTRKGDRAHVYEIHPRADGVDVEVGSTLPQALHQGHTIPKTDPEPVAQAVADALYKEVKP